MGISVNIKYKLSSIDIVKFEMNANDNTSLDISSDTLKFQYKIETLIKMSANVIGVKSSIRFTYNETTILEVSAIINYNVDSLQEVISVDKENHRLTSKADILPTFVATSYSTLRGIVHAKTTETPLSKYPIPMIEVQTLMNRNAICVED